MKSFRLSGLQPRPPGAVVSRVARLCSAALIGAEAFLTARHLFTATPANPFYIITIMFVSLGAALVLLDKHSGRIIVIVGGALQIVVFSLGILVGGLKMFIGLVGAGADPMTEGFWLVVFSAACVGLLAIAVGIFMGKFWTSS